MKSYLLIFILWLAGGPLVAQTDMIWDAYGLGFTLPSGMAITANDGEVFSAERHDLWLTIVPVPDRHVGPEELADAVVEMADALEYDSLTDADEIALQDLYGYYVEGRKDGAMAVVMALMDVESHGNFLVVIVYTGASRNRAIGLAQSFYAYDGD